MKSSLQEAITGFSEKQLSCSQAVLTAYCESFGLSRELAVKLAAPFGGGMGRTGQVCGAVSGALMVIGLALASSDPGDKEAKAMIYEQTRAFIELFKERHGALACPDLIGCDLGTEEGRRLAEERGVSTKICAPLVRDTIEQLLKIVPYNSK